MRVGVAIVAVFACRRAEVTAPERAAPVDRPERGEVVAAPAPVAPAELAEVPAPVEAVAAVEAVEPEVTEPCKAVVRGEEVRGHEFVGETVAALAERGGTVLCGRGSVWQLRFGTLCGDLSSFHDVVTVEVRAGKVRRVWVRKDYNDSFCGGYE